MGGETVRHGAYVCISPSDTARAGLAGAPVPSVAARFGLKNEFLARDGHPGNAIAYLRRVAQKCLSQITHDDLRRDLNRLIAHCDRKIDQCHTLGS